VNDEIKASNATDEPQFVSGAGLQSQIDNAMRTLDGLRHVSIDEQLRRAMENVTNASVGLKDSLASFPDLYPSRFIPLEVPLQKFPIPAAPPNPIHQTNKGIDQLNKRVDALLEIAKQQATLTEAINESTQATLRSAVQSGHLARIAIFVAIVSPFISALIGIGFSVYLDRRHSTANDVGAVQEHTLRAQEVKVLNDISVRLAADAKERSEAAAASLQNKNHKPANLGSTSHP
jgi:hypothetical protein